MKAADLGQVVKTGQDELRAVYQGSTLPKAYPTKGAALKGRRKSADIIENNDLYRRPHGGLLFYRLEIRFCRPSL